MAVTGTNGKTSVTLLVNRILTDAGYRTGASCTEGVLMGREWVKRGDEAGAKGLWRASRRFRLDAVVAETARGGILRNGLGFSSCQVSVVTNLYDDHLGLRGIDTVEQMAEVKSILPRRTRADGVTVLNLDQPLVRDMSRCTPAKVVFFSLETPPSSIGDCFFLRDGIIVRKRGSAVEAVVAAREIYLTHDGAVPFQIANAMAALAVVEALHARLPVPRSSWARSLADFGRDRRDLPHRFQLFRYRGMDLLLSASKNPETYAQEIPLIRSLARAHGYQRLVCLLSDVGNRNEQHYHAVSRAVGEVADAVVCVPPLEKYLRGRTGDEIVRLLSSEIPPDKLLKPEASSLEVLIRRLRDSGSDSTLYVSFGSTFYGSATFADILSTAERLQPRFQ